jgi:hypothetical protein
MFSEPWIPNRIRIDLKGWIRINIKTNADAERWIFFLHVILFFIIIFVCLQAVLRRDRERQLRGGEEGKAPAPRPQAEGQEIPPALHVSDQTGKYTRVLVRDLFHFSINLVVIGSGYRAWP